MNTIHALASAPLSPYLASKKLEFLYNATLHLDRDLHDTGFFTDLGTLVSSRAEALELCAPAFAADGADKWGRKPRRSAKDRNAPMEPFRQLASSIADPPEEEEDEDCFDIDEFEDLCNPSSEVLDGDHDHIAVPDGSPFSKDRPIYLGLESVWRGTDGIEPMRKNIAELVKRHLAKARARRAVQKDPIRTQFQDLVDLLRLSPVEANLLVFLHLFYQDECDWFRRITTTPFPSPRGQIVFVRIAAGVLGVRVDRVREALSGDAPLFRYGLVSEDDFDLSRQVVRLFSGVGKGDLRSVFYHPIETEALPWDYFPEALREHGEIIEALVHGVRDRGLDILFHGVAGAGKTSFARSLAERLGMRAVAIAIDETESGEGGERRRRRDPTSTDGAQAAFRLGALAVAEKQCDPGRDLLVIDEADTLLRAVGANRLNRALDDGRCVRIWLGNLAPGILHDSNLRRFDYAIEFEPLGPRERTSIWRNAIARFHLDGIFTDDDLRDFSERYPISAGGISRVCENLAATHVGIEKGREAAIDFANRLQESHARLLGVKCRPSAAPKRVSAGYVLDGLAIKGDVFLPDLLAASREHLRRLSAGDAGDGAALRDPPRLNILLSGPPGCGKTEFVRWLGEQLGRKVVILGASDLKDKYVGETEKRIAKSFREAERDGAVLFFDEVDSFLRSRASADHAWEISETNEILARLEDFKGLFVAATNFPSSLDPAVLRRFTFKMSFGYLDAAGKRVFFSRFFEDALTETEGAELDAIPNLCPGDFRTVRQRLDYLPGGASNARRLAALREESDRKAALPPSGDFDASPRRAIGF